MTSPILPRARCLAVWLSAALTVCALRVEAVPMQRFAACPHPPSPRDASLASETRRAQAPVHITADYETGLPDDVYHLRGDVVVQRADQRVQAHEMIYDQVRQAALADGEVHLQQGGLTLEGEHAFVDMGTDQAEITRARYQLSDSHVRGVAQQVEMESRELLYLNQATYTTCELGDEAWYLSASRIRLDRGSGFGEAYNVIPHFMGVPFFYLPYINFPISDERKTGFLIPTLNPVSPNGVEVRIPWYWNIAPQADATITPIFMSQRGLMTDVEFRHLEETGKGQVDLNYLPSDEDYGADRGLFRLRHNARFLGWTVDADINYVSDVEYFHDFGNSLSTANVSFVERHLDLRYQLAAVSFLTRLQGYQTVDRTLPSAQRPYRRLPEFDLTTQQVWDTGLSLRTQNQYVYFDQTDRVTGGRADFYPELAWTTQRTWGYLTPSLAARYTRYDLHDPDLSVDRGLPLLALDGGLFFERDVIWRGGAALQTLEPRIYYLYVPYNDQANIPAFDTGVADFNYPQLFRANRFTGSDRQGDANQLSLGLTTRWLTPDTGYERWHASAGRAVFLTKPRVTLPGVTPETRERSNLVAEAGVNLTPQWTANITGQWRGLGNVADQGALSMQYQRDAQHVLNLSYRYRRGELEQTDVAFFWGIRHGWSVIGRWNQSLLDGRPLEVLGGVEYDSCCWALRVVSRNYVTGVATRNNAVMVQLELKGLMSVGQSITHLLERGILGYKPLSE